MDPKKDIFATSKGRWDFFIAALVIGLCGVFVYFTMFATNKNPISEPPLTTTDTVNIREAPTLAEQEIAALTTYKPVKIVKEDAYEATDSLPAVVLSDFEPETIVPVSDSSKKQISTENVEPQEEMKKSESTVEKIVAVDSIQPVSEDAVTMEKSTAPNATTALDCTIIVGVFRNPDNKAAILKELKTLGYETKEGLMKKGVSYVGVPVECTNETKKRALLNSLNKAFEIDSWVKKTGN